MQNLSYKPGSIGLVFEHLPPGASEKECQDLLWFGVPGGMNFPVEQLSCKRTENGLGSTCIAVVTPEVLRDFISRILEQGKSPLKVRSHQPNGRQSARRTC